MKEEWYEVKNWQKYQHYKDRNPPWVKLHVELLSSPDWVMLADASRVLMIACIILASKNEGKIPANPEYVRRVAYLKKVDFNPLISCGFLVPASGCKQMLADARPEAYRSTERSTDKSTEAEGKKQKFLDFVFLTEDELQKLKEKLNSHTDEYLERLNHYIGSKGKKYKSHYHTILAWYAKDQKEQTGKPTSRWDPARYKNV